MTLLIIIERIIRKFLARSKSVVYSRSNSGKGRGKYKKRSNGGGSVAASITSYSSEDNIGPEKPSNG